MQLVNLPLLTIIAESVLKERLIEELTRAGAKGYTMSDAVGDGSRQFRSGDLPGDNVRIETITTTEVAERLLTLLNNDYFPHFAIIAFVSEVRVVRGDKYV
ncbi:MAG TPA: hypothetical protein PLV92_13620 [Pirellulaceae bacterium]|nr:hypothetical protein [Pirellulaceae bacterium]